MTLDALKKIGESITIWGVECELKGWANYGMPKLWKYRPGPMTFWEKVIFCTGFGLVWGYRGF